MYNVIVYTCARVIRKAVWEMYGKMFIRRKRIIICLDKHIVNDVRFSNITKNVRINTSAFNTFD